jgi:cell wall-associated NlpC family hydrolase
MRLPRSTTICLILIILVVGGCTTTASPSDRPSIASPFLDTDGLDAGKESGDSAGRKSQRKDVDDDTLAALVEGDEATIGSAGAATSESRDTGTTDSLGDGGSVAVLDAGASGGTSGAEAATLRDLAGAGGTDGLPAGQEPGEADDGLADVQMRILAAAEDLLRTQNFVVEGHRYSCDCTGVVLVIYHRAGLRLIDLFPGYSGNGVQVLNGIAGDRDLLYTSDYPAPGDLIFWDNTYDKNHDTLWNDGLTHVGLVLDVDDEGTIDFVHYDYRDGVVRARMNLLHPDTYTGDDGELVNSPMRMASHRYLNPSEWLSGQLFRVLAAMYRIEM